MATEYEIVDALVTRLQDLTGLHPYHFPEPEMQSPAAFPLFDQSFNVDFGSDDGGNSGPIDGEIVVCTLWGKGLSRAGARTLGDYLADAGEKSINQALHGDTLGGIVPPIRVKGVKRVELITFPDGRAYWGRALEVRIYP